MAVARTAVYLALPARCLTRYGLTTATRACTLLSTAPALQNVPINCLNGDVALPFGSPAFIGLGFAVFAMIVVLELFGSPFMRNVEVIIALLVGYMIAGIATYDGKKVSRRRAKADVCMSSCEELDSTQVDLAEGSMFLASSPESIETLMVLFW